MRIINDLLFFCHYAGATEYEARVSPKHGSTCFEIRAKIPQMDEELKKTLDDALKLPRMHEIEQNYWGLEADVDAANELTLTGMMLDASEAVYADGILTITAERTD